jgi:hypothetical protein
MPRPVGQFSSKIAVMRLLIEIAFIMNYHDMTRQRGSLLSRSANIVF